MKDTMTTNQKEPTVNTIEKTARQGDVMLERVDRLPEGVTAAKRDEHGHIVLAYGEHSGHRHAIRDKAVTSFRLAGSEDLDYIEVGGSGAVLNHEYVSGVKADHEPIALSPGVYRVVRQKEYVAPDIERRVED